MDQFRFIDIYATKGIEYLIVLAFLASIVVFYRYFMSDSGTTARKGWLSMFAGKAHLADMRWDPMMAHMKQPSKEDEEEEKKKGAETSKKKQ